MADNECLSRRSRQNMDDVEVAGVAVDTLVTRLTFVKAYSGKAVKWTLWT